MAEQAALERLLADLRSPIDESALSESFSDVGLEDLLVAAAAGDGGSDGDREEGGGEDLPVSGRVVASLQAENASLRRRAKLAAAQAQADLQTYRATAEAAQARTRDEVTSLREALLAVQVEMPKLRDRLVASKQEFASLRISAEQYRAIVTQEHRPQATPKRQAAPDATHRRRACACSQRLHGRPPTSSAGGRADERCAVGAGAGARDARRGGSGRSQVGHQRTGSQARPASVL